MDRILETQDGTFAVDSLAGPVYSSEPQAVGQGEDLTAQGKRAQIIEILVWPWKELCDQRPALRRYFCLSMNQAVARATEIAVRLHAQQRPAELICIRPATDVETDVFFRVMDVFECALPAANDATARRGIHEDMTACERNREPNP